MGGGCRLNKKREQRRKNAKVGKTRKIKRDTSAGDNTISEKSDEDAVGPDVQDANDNSEGSPHSEQTHDKNSDETSGETESAEQHVDANFISTAAKAAKFSVVSNSQDPPHVDITGDPNKGPVTVVIRDERGKEHVFILPANSDEGSSSTTRNGVDYGGAISDLVDASNKGHIQAMHRLGMIYSHGIKREDSRGSNSGTPLEWDPEFIIAPNCNAAVNMFRQISDASPSISRRTRRGYQQFKAGDYHGALTNYMAAAESGSEVGMVNAAWLLERHCPTEVADRKSCIKASVRYWSEAARLGDPEANLNLGDYYYYNKGDDDLIVDDENGNELVSRAEKVLNYILYPETVWKQGRAFLFQATKKFLLMILKKKDKSDQSKTASSDDSIDARQSSEGKQRSVSVSDNLKTAALYYKRAASEFKSPRANFNLGFMHQWGVGLKQDFPLAKRHYDLAANSSPSEAGTAVQLALWGMHWHESLLRLQVSWNENYDDDGTSTSPDDSYEIKKYRIQLDGFFARLMSWESLLISFLLQLLLLLWRSCQRGALDRL